MPRAVRRAPALLGADSGSGVGMPALDFARLENAGAGRYDRMDREHKAHGQAVKDIHVYPLVHDARQQLCGDLTR